MSLHDWLVDWWRLNDWLMNGWWLVGWFLHDWLLAVWSSWLVGGWLASAWLVGGWLVVGWLVGACMIGWWMVGVHHKWFGWLDCWFRPHLGSISATNVTLFKWNMWRKKLLYDIINWAERSGKPFFKMMVLQDGSGTEGECQWWRFLLRFLTFTALFWRRKIWPKRGGLCDSRYVCQYLRIKGWMGRFGIKCA